ncbi:MAG: protein kinase [Candidatus Aminicenantes bacterium]|nr:protein kinase [Candidatus Aminicenantes bacterium]
MNSNDYNERARVAQLIGNIPEAADCYYNAGKLEKAAELFEWINRYERAAECYFKVENYIAAAHNYVKANQKEKAAKMFELERAFEKAADIRFELKQYNEAGELYERAKNFFKAGKAFAFTDKYSTALSYLEKVSKTDKNFWEANLIRAEIYSRILKPNSVLEKILPICEHEKIDRANVGLFLIIGQTYEKVNRIKDALSFYRKIFVFDPKHPNIQKKISDLEELKEVFTEIQNEERYQKKHKVGMGAMGVVYLADDLKLKREIALKILSTEAFIDGSDIERFFSEAEKIAKLNHPNIVHVYDTGKIAGEYFIAMEFINGQNLLNILNTFQPMPILTILIIACKLFSALHHSHQKDIIHRDIKPNNIIITYDNELKVIDFGIAVLKDDLIKRKKNVILGTPLYMSPEQIEAKTTDHSTDIYSAGVTLFHLLTNQPPFSGSFLEIMDQHLNKQIPPIKDLRPDTPGKLIKIIEKCMAKKTGDRYRSALDVIKEIDQIRYPDGKSTRPTKDTLNIFDEINMETFRLKEQTSEVNTNKFDVTDSNDCK